MAKRKGQTDKQRATKHTHKTIDRVIDCHEGVQGPIILQIFYIELSVVILHHRIARCISNAAPYAHERQLTAIFNYQ
jgi:hypothetical protein